MAYYAALDSVVQLLEEITPDRYPNFLLKKNRMVKSLHEKLGLLLASLEDYSSKGDEAADRLESRFTAVAYRAHYIIAYQFSNHIHSGDGSIFQKLISTFKKVILRKHDQVLHEVKDEQVLQEVKEEVDSLLEKVMRIKRSRISEDVHLNFDSLDVGGSEQAPDIGSTMVGFDDQLTTIKGHLCGESSKLNIIPIIGMGGIGKTTLARNVFDDNLIAYHFHVRLWVTISQDYHILRVLRSIEHSINVTNREKPKVDEGELMVYIYKYLKGRRYLVIMDDMWDTKVWDDIKSIFPDDCNGSRIVLTTRLSDVADYAGTLGFLQVQFLNEEQSWNLFREKVFGQEHCPRELEYPGKSIANHCQGLPLAIVILAGLLTKVSKTQSEWIKIARNVSSAATSSNDEHIAKILSLSYNHLPNHLKPCLLYMGVIPEDYEISASRLVRLWIAEGLVRPSESKNLEEVGKEYLKDLVIRNLVLMTKKGYNGELKYCSIHDLLRELCIERRINNFFHVVVDEEAERCLHFSHRSSTRPDDIGLYVRSILCFQDFEESEGLLTFRFLRVLDAREVIFESFPDSIFNLLHLRYLAFGVPNVRGNYYDHRYRIPPTIATLHYLQTLIVKGAISLPSEIWMMPQLRHVSAYDLYLSPIIPLDATSVAGKVHVLENLQTLSSVTNFTFTNEILEMIPNLKTLKVLSIEPENTWQQYCNNLDHLLQLEKLRIMFVDYNVAGAKPFPESFSFPQNLKALTLRNCQLPWKDMSVAGSLPKLEVLKLCVRAVKGEVWEPIEGEFLQLKFLVLEMLDLKHWKAEDIHFPRLQHLRISWCPRLKKIPLEIGEIPTLNLIEVRYNTAAANSAMEILEEQRSLGNDTLQVRVRSTRP